MRERETSLFIQSGGKERLWNGLHKASWEDDIPRRCTGWEAIFLHFQMFPDFLAECVSPELSVTSEGSLPACSTGISNQTLLLGKVDNMIRILLTMVCLRERVGQHLETFSSCYYSYLFLKRRATTAKALRTASPSAPGCIPLLPWDWLTDLEC